MQRNASLGDAQSFSGIKPFTRAVGGPRSGCSLRHVSQLAPCRSSRRPANVRAYAVAKDPGATVEYTRDGSLLFRFGNAIDRSSQTENHTGSPAVDSPAAQAQHEAESRSNAQEHAETSSNLQIPPTRQRFSERPASNGAAAPLQQQPKQQPQHAAASEPAAAEQPSRQGYAHGSYEESLEAREAPDDRHSRRRSFASSSRQSDTERVAGIRTSSQEHAAFAAAVLEKHGADAAKDEPLKLCGLFSDLAHRGKLPEALAVVEALVLAKRTDVLPRLIQKHFLRTAEKRCDVEDALRFVQLLPRGAADLRTYNMLVSVCAAAQNARAALQALDMWRSTGRKPDTILYTNAIAACAEAGDAEAATSIYNQMLAEGCKLDRHVFATLISAFAGAVQGADAADRRTHLVLLERAVHLLDDMKDAHVNADVPVYNALINLSGRAGQLQRCLEMVKEMEEHHCRPDAHTYATLIDACTRSGKPDIALKIYARAMSAKVVDNLLVYSAAISACRSFYEPDAQQAVKIYNDLQRNGVEPDSQLYSTLMSVAGAAGDVDLAFSLLDEMEAETLKPCAESYSTLLLVCVANDQLKRAFDVYEAMRARQLSPHIRAFNGLIAATGRAFRLGDVVDLVQDMLAAGHKPDEFTFAALLGACQRAEESELAFDLLRLMKARGFKVGEAHCFTLLRLCYNCMRALWRPGGYPPTATTRALIPGTRHSPEGAALLRALDGQPRPPAEAASTEADWRTRALSVYREALASAPDLASKLDVGPPRLHVLDRLLACLREQRPDAAAAPASDSRVDVQTHEAWMGVPLPAGGDRPDASNGEWGSHADKAVLLLEEAISLGTLPGFKLGGKCMLDMRGLPPNVAEIYVLAVMQQLLRSRKPRTRVEHSIRLMVPPYDPHHIFSPSYYAGSEDELEAHYAPAVRLEVTEKPECDEGYEYVATTATGLGVAAMIRRLRLYAEEDAERGMLYLSSKELTRWTRVATRAEVNSRNKPTAAAAVWEPGLLRNAPLARQARDIRLGDGPKQEAPSWQSVLQTGGQRSVGGAPRSREGRRSAGPYDLGDSALGMLGGHAA